MIGTAAKTVRNGPMVTTRSLSAKRTRECTEVDMDVDPDQEMDVSQGQATNKAEDNKDEERDGDGDDSEDASSAENDSDEVAPADDDALDETSGGSRHYGARKRTKQATSTSC
ncbi:hypothetical protein GN244_ATG01414 [Phytophthora infestans]|uniref:Uncharacterized protein n=1 Tax=Phytophthora infestans TaxID=4787 RepID=A0A833SUQ5_PHYIN|nr:hypothetical protein GN244_ATG01414 [Phytophthora infestans]